MNDFNFEVPQRQSALGILLIFSKVSYKIIRAFWAPVLVLLFTGSNKAGYFHYIEIGGVVLVILGIIYSYFYYRQFLFHIDRSKEELILNKGVFSSETLNIPFDKIQQVDLKRSLLQRLINVYSVSIDTAGSKGDELTIHAMTEDRANALYAELMAAKLQTKPVDENVEKDAPPKENAYPWTYKVTPWTLFKVGLTRSYRRGFALMIAFVVTLYNQLQDLFSDYISHIEASTEAYFAKSFQSIAFILTLCIIVFILSILVTIGEVFLKYFGLKLIKTTTHLELEMGLKTNTKVILQPRRLQQLDIITNPIQKWLNLYELKFSIASKQDDLAKSKIRMPGLTKDIIEKSSDYLYESRSFGIPEKYQVDRRWMRRGIYIAIVPFLIVWLLEFGIWGGTHWIILLGLSLIYITLVLLLQYLTYRSIRLSISKEFLIIRQGFWKREKKIIELYKMQGFTVRQPFYYKKSGLRNISFHTAGGDVKVRTLTNQFVIELNYLLYKIESSEKKWM